ncbi:MAG TPA: NAD(P)-dependent oxidoreductase [Pyrinomonadaceae bacterium]|jgi:nucleoside-diphosphate-sugar epimerase|nr:NAD(P)-dependent oxidoreductase [Pyrinomonadaceae bacterium]
MKVFIAGATGVLGRRMVGQFLARGHSVVGLARDEKGRQTIERLGGEAVVGDIFDSGSLAAAVGRADVVIHAATSIPTKISGGRQAWEMNDRLRREGTRALTEAAARVGAGTYVQQSIVWVARPADDSFFDEKTEVKEPDELYRSAFDGERIARDAGERYGFNVAVLRCGGFYAPDASHTRMFAQGLLRRRLPLLGGGRAVSANLHADDAASAFVAAAEAGRRGLWHVTDDEPVTIKEMLVEFASRLGAPAPRRIPLWLARLFVWKGALEFFTRSTLTSNRLFREEVGWAPRFPSFRAGLGDVVGTWRSEGFAN